MSVRSLFIVPGTGNFHCGSCLRDHELIRSLRSRGNDALIASLYLPWVSDEQDDLEPDEIFFGGINAYLQQKSALFRRTPRWVDRLLDSRALLRFSAGLAHLTRPADLGDLTLSMIDGTTGRQAKELERLMSWITSAHNPQVVNLNNALLMGLAPQMKERTGAAVICTLQGEDTFIDSLPDSQRDRVWKRLGELVESVDAFVAVSAHHGRIMTERMAIPQDKLHVIYNGVAIDDFQPADQAPGVTTLGYLARLCPAKGLDSLISAYIEMTQRDGTEDVQLLIVGAMSPGDRRFVRAQQRRIERAGLSDRVTWRPNVSRDEKVALLGEMSLLCVPAMYGESFGMYVIEAWASGVPVALPRSAGLAELLEIGGEAAIACESVEAGPLAETLTEALSDPERLREKGQHARRLAESRFSHAAMVDQIEKLFESVVECDHHTEGHRR